jgi:small-conductance mechanosensitive channel
MQTHTLCRYCLLLAHIYELAFFLMPSTPVPHFNQGLQQHDWPPLELLTSLVSLTILPSLLMVGMMVSLHPHSSSLVVLMFAASYLLSQDHLPSVVTVFCPYAIPLTLVILQLSVYLLLLAWSCTNFLVSHVIFSHVNLTFVLTGSLSSGCGCSSDDLSISITPSFLGSSKHVLSVSDDLVCSDSFDVGVLPGTVVILEECPC